jgi:ubiquinone biosynthesis monooxygenase Coq7
MTSLAWTRRTTHGSNLARTILRLDHAGEAGAIRIYRAQIVWAARRFPDLLPFLTDTLGHEERHARLFERLLVERGGRACPALFVWTWGGAALGFLTGMLGRRAVLVCTEAVERTVHRHMQEQVLQLETVDPEAAAVIGEIMAEEAGHLATARAGQGAPRAGAAALDAFIAAVTEALVWTGMWAAQLSGGRP